MNLETNCSSQRTTMPPRVSAAHCTHYGSKPIRVIEDEQATERAETTPSFEIAPADRVPIFVPETSEEQLHFNNVCAVVLGEMLDKPLCMYHTRISTPQPTCTGNGRRMQVALATHPKAVLAERQGVETDCRPPAIGCTGLELCNRPSLLGPPG